MARRASDINETSEQAGEALEAETRREALARMGRYAAYTTPTMMTLLVADKAVASGGRRGKAKGHAKAKKHR
jgi:hypothetical protein